MSTNHSSAEGGGLALPLSVQPDPYDRTEWVIVEPNSRVVCWVRGLRSEADALVRSANHFPELMNLLIEADALLCDKRGGPAANELAARIRAALSHAEQVKP